MPQDTIAKIKEILNTADKLNFDDTERLSELLDQLQIELASLPNSEKAQALEIARSNVRLVAAVSCNSKSFARDARILIDGGYKLNALTLVDQFLHSAHIELVGIFEKKPETKRPRRLLG